MFSRVFPDWVAGIFVGRVVLYLLSLSSSAGDSKLALSDVGSGLVVVSGLGSGVMTGLISDDVTTLNPYWSAEKRILVTLTTLFAVR